MQILDQSGDTNGQQLYRLLKLYELPQFVKSAASNDVYGNDELANHLYADPVHRQFPCHTAPALYVSTLFFMSKQAEFQRDEAEMITNRLDDFAFLHGVTEDIAKLRSKLAEEKKTAESLNDDDYAIVLTDEKGNVERHYPLRNALEVKRAAEYLEEYAATIPFKHRTKIANKILEKADQFGAGLGDLDDFLQKNAGMGVCAGENVASFLWDRAKLLRRGNNIEYAIKLAEMAKEVAGRPYVAHDSDNLVKLAGIVDDIDRQTGLTRFVDDLPKPEDVFFSITVKKASQLREAHFATTSGNIYSREDFSNLKLADVRSMMGDDFAAAVSAGGLLVSTDKLAEIAPTLPRGDAELFDRMLASFGISPVAKEAAHQSGGFDTEDLQELAKLHRAV